MSANLQQTGPARSAAMDPPPITAQGTGQNPLPVVRSMADLRKAGVHQQTAKQAGGTTVEAFFIANKSAMAAMLPRHMDADRMVRIALRALRTTPKLMDCTLDSMMAAVITCSNLGLEPNTPLGHVYLIPFNGRRKSRGGQWEDYVDVQVVIGYKGMVDLARRSGEIVSISTHVVRAADTFEIEYGLEEKLVHKPNLLEEKPSPVIGAYAVAKLKGGGAQFEFMTLADLHQIRAGSQGYLSAMENAEKYKKDPKNPWIQNEEEMMRKSPLRRLFKMLPISIELASAMALDDKLALKDLHKVLDGVEYTEIAGELENAPTSEQPEDSSTPPPAETTAPGQTKNVDEAKRVQGQGTTAPETTTATPLEVVDQATGEVRLATPEEVAEHQDAHSPEAQATDREREAQYVEYAKQRRPASPRTQPQQDSGLPLAGGR